MRMKQAAANIKAIFKRELFGYFNSPVAYVFIVIFLLLLGFFTFYISNFFEMGQADLRSFFSWHPWVYLLLVPALAMRLWSEERRLGTIELLLTLPISVMDAIIAKFLAAWVFIGFALFFTFPMVLTVIYLGRPDIGAIICAYLGSFLMAGAFLSVGAMTSALTKSQVVSFIVAVVICLFFILAGFPPVTNAMADWAPLWLINLVAETSFLSHFIAIERGVMDLRDVLYFFSVMAFLLFLNGLIIQNRRAS